VTARALAALPLETDFRHTRSFSTGPYVMDAAIMLLGRHERGIHAV
jgi:hypothetical protein